MTKSFPFSRLLASYIAAELMAPFAASFIIVTGVMLLARLVPFIELILEYGIGMTNFIRVYSYIAPQLLLFSVPMASMMGAIICFTRLTNSREIMALKASGLSLYRLLVPLCIFALFTTALTWIASTYLLPEGHRAMQQLFIQLAKDKIDKGIPAKEFSEGLGGVVLYVDTIDDDGSWHGVYVSDVRDPKGAMTILARKGSLQADMNNMALTLHLYDGSIHRAKIHSDQTVTFKQYTLLLPVKLPEKFTTSAIKRLDRKGMNQEELLLHATRLGLDDRKGRELYIEYVRRIVLPMGCLFLTLVGMPLGLLAAPGRRAIGIPVGLMLFILYYVVLTAGKSLAEEHALAIGPALWSANILFAILAFFMLRSSMRETTPLPLASLQEGIAVTLERLTSFWEITYNRIQQRYQLEKDVHTATRAPAAHQRFDLHQLLEDTMTSYAVEAEARRIGLFLVQSDAIPHFITGNPLKLRKILEKQIEQALEFSSSGDITVHIRLGEQDAAMEGIYQGWSSDDDHVFADKLSLMISVEYTGIAVPGTEIDRRALENDSADTEQTDDRPSMHEDFRTLPFKGNTVSRILHAPWCDHYECSLCHASFSTFHEARKAGFAPCGRCRPDQPPPDEVIGS